MRDDQQSALVTLWSWSASEVHLQRPPSLQALLYRPDQDHRVEKVLSALHCTPGKPANQSPLGARKSSASPATPSQPLEARGKTTMASEGSDGGWACQRGHVHGSGGGGAHARSQAPAGALKLGGCHCASAGCKPTATTVLRPPCPPRRGGACHHAQPQLEPGAGGDVGRDALAGAAQSAE